MNCEKIKEIILTDYVDNELSASLRRVIDEHLSFCSDCKHFAQQVKERAVKPFKEADELQPPESVWENIKQAISENQPTMHEADVDLTLKEKFEFFFGRRKPVLALATAMAAIVISIGIIKFPFKSQGAIEEYMEEQVAFYCSLDENGENGLNEDCAYFGTALEDYFL